LLFKAAVILIIESEMVSSGVDLMAQTAPVKGSLFKQGFSNLLIECSALW